MRSTSTAIAWSCAMDTPSHGRWSPEPDRSRSGPHESTTAGSTKRPARGCGSAVSILPPWARKSPKVAEVLPLMYLHGMSSGDFAPALEEFFGSAAGLSASVITRLTTDWQRERDQFAHRSLKDVDYVYVYADGIHFNVRLEEARLCALVIVGVRADGTKELVSISDGHRESTESWADVLRGLKRRGMSARCSPSATAHSAFGVRSATSSPTPPHQRAGSTRWPTS